MQIALKEAVKEDKEATRNKEERNLPRDEEVAEAVVKEIKNIII